MYSSHVHVRIFSFYKIFVQYSIKSTSKYLLPAKWEEIVKN